MHKPDGWRPDSAIDDDAVLPISPGRHLNVGYATEVLYAVWAWKTGNPTPSSPPHDVPRNARTAHHSTPTASS
ncbi:hypothetical protein [Gordonia mangrovi]|uniref:hypothetical protein n=1 Tax=Gordonia mangrovi TaxID=2665643 RepID=UPI0021ACDCF6|nr:hypothetical protein [Gordonia mangrovi]UVF80945.1 hypothetical protein NWF22_05170 [Gordonia mangrovi]